MLIATLEDAAQAAEDVHATAITRIAAGVSGGTLVVAVRAADRLPVPRLRLAGVAGVAGVAAEQRLPSHMGVALALGVAAGRGLAVVATIALEQTVHFGAQPMAETITATRILAGGATGRATSGSYDGGGGGGWRRSARLSDQHGRRHQQERSIHEDSSIIELKSGPGWHPSDRGTPPLADLPAPRTPRN